MGLKFSWSCVAMMPKSLAITLVVALALGACGPQYVEIETSVGQDVPSRRAFFAANPSGLDEAFAMGCSSPSDRFWRPDGNTARCDIVPTPQSAAFLLTEFDARLEAPKIVLEKTTRSSGACFIVEMRYFAEITAKSGNAQRVYVPNQAMDRRIDRILQASGGTSVDTNVSIACEPSA